MLKPSSTADVNYDLLSGGDSSFTVEYTTDDGDEWIETIDQRIESNRIEKKVHVREIGNN